jgi:hypothetical protein
MTGPTNSGNEVAALGTSFDMGWGMGGGEVLELAGVVAAVVGSVMTPVGRKQPAPATLD